jgi:hypothetical protein
MLHGTVTSIPKVETEIGFERKFHSLVLAVEVVRGPTVTEYVETL